MRSIVALILSAFTAFGAVGSWNGVAFTAWNGVVQTAWNGTAISCASGGASPTYVFWENFEGTPRGWSKQNDATWVDLVSTTSPIQGSQSLYVQGDDNDTQPPYAFRTAPFGEMPDCYQFIAFVPVEGPVDDDYSREMGWMVDYPANNHLAEFDLYRFGAGDYRPRIVFNTTGTATPTAGFALNTLIGMLIRYQKGTGSNARCDVWWNPITAVVGSTLTWAKPADGSSHHAHRDDGTYTTSVEQIQWGAINRSGETNKIRYDCILVSDGVIIADNPVIPATYTTIQEQNSGSVASQRHVGFDTTDYYAGQLIDFGATITVGTVSFNVTAAGTIEGNTYKCEIWSNSGGNLGTQIAVSNGNKANSGWSAHAINFYFPTPFSHASGTSYWYVITKNAAPSSSNYIDLNLTAAGGFTGTSGFFTSAGVSSGTSTSDHMMVVYK